MDGGARGPHDDFFCWRYRVWYRLGDCVFRHAFRTTAVCACCEQGGANLRVFGRVPPRPHWAEIPSIGEGESEA